MPGLLACPLPTSVPPRGHSPTCTPKVILNYLPLPKGLVGTGLGPNLLPGPEASYDPSHYFSLALFPLIHVSAPPNPGSALSPQQSQGPQDLLLGPMVVL